MANFKERLLILRKEKRATQAQVAKAIEISERSYRDYEIKGA